MKTKLTLLSVFALLFLAGSLRAQDNSDKMLTKIPHTRAFVDGTNSYTWLPNEDQLKYQNPNKTTRTVHTPNGDLLLPPNVRPVPATATESEVDATIMLGNQNTMYASWNSYGPSFFGSGFAFTSDGGVTWSGNTQNMNPANNGGDPGVWIWPSGSSWGGRLGASDLNGAYTAVIGFYSTNNGTNWSAPVTFGNTGSVDKNLSAVDDVTGSPFFGRAYTVWSNFSVARPPIVSSFTTDGGASWSASVQVSPVDDGSHYCQGCDIMVGPGGVVYVCWAYNVSGSPFTEDFLGFAKSTNGGVTWTGATNNAVNTNGIRNASFLNGIRADGFPRLCVDKSGGSRNGWIYVAMGEKTTAPATDNADMCLMRSTDGGTTWTHTKINQDASGRLQFMGDIVVDPGGGVNCSYYDQRNTTGNVCEFWMSRSVDGGNTWTDVAVSDHTFTPAPIPGLAGGYQGDYTGITAGNGKIWPFWAENSSGTYQVWTVGITYGPPPAHDISAGPFTSLPGQLIINTPYNIKSKFTNVGANNETAIPCKYFVDGVLINTTNINLNIGQTDSVNNSWQTPAAGNHTLKYVCALGTDVNRNNDTVTVVVNVLPSVPVIHQDVFCHGGLNIPIPDLGTAVDNIAVNVSNSTTVTDVNVRIDSVFHTYDGDLQFQLTKGSTTVNFIQNVGTSGDNFIGTILNDSASTPIASGVAPFTGSYMPSTPLSGFNGATLNGTWTLTITDQAGQDSGVLKAWCLVISYNALVGGISTVEVPNYYSLGQNYPNPFNPSTNIKYTIPKAGLVTLKIFDVVGREVATLVNEVKSVGVYNVDFNASNLSSGVYFYKIQAGDFTSIKKMVLVK